MTAAALLSVLLLLAGVVLMLLCCTALPLFRDPFARLHVASLASIAGPVAVALAVLLTRPESGLALHAVLFAGFAVASGAAATHALARALRLRQGKQIRLQEKDE